MRANTAIKHFATTAAFFTASLLASGQVLAAASAGGQLTAAQQERLQIIINRGNQEITRRLSTLNKLGVHIGNAARLTTSDKNYLTSEVNAEIAGLTSLKSQLDTATSLTTARADAQSIIDEYRVYALVVPKVFLVKTADDQQVAESRLTALAQKLQSRITSAQNAGKEVSALQADLAAMTGSIQTAQSISSSIETKVLTLQPGDFNSDHSILDGDAAQLQAAHSDNQAVYNTAKTIVAALKNLG